MNSFKSSLLSTDVRSGSKAPVLRCLRLAALPPTAGSGATQYTYFPIGVLGALQVQQEGSTVPTIAYAYDELGRLASRTVTGAGAETFGYDAIGRLTSHANDLGQFTLSYLARLGK
jgi:hypothetical protein